MFQLSVGHSKHFFFCLPYCIAITSFGNTSSSKCPLKHFFLPLRWQAILRTWISFSLHRIRRDRLTLKLLVFKYLIAAMRDLWEESMLAPDSPNFRDEGCKEWTVWASLEEFLSSMFLNEKLFSFSRLWKRRHFKKPYSEFQNKTNSFFAFLVFL